MASLIVRTTAQISIDALISPEREVVGPDCLSGQIGGAEVVVVQNDVGSCQMALQVVGHIVRTEGAAGQGDLL